LPTDRHEEAPHRRRLGWVLAVALLSLPATARADDIVAVYAAYWAGLPAAEIRLRLHDGAAAYHDEIEIRTTGLPALLSKFRGTALAEGRLAADQPAEPSHYDAVYDLRKRRNSHISMRFVPRAGAVVAERGPDDTSRKPPLAEKFRSNAVDPMTALERLRGVLRARPHSADGSFAIPVYDGARRFDAIVERRPPSTAEPGIRLAMTLRAIAGFKGESSDEGDPDDAPRLASLTLSDNERLLPLAMTVAIWYLPLDVTFVRTCATAAECAW